MGVGYIQNMRNKDIKGKKFNKLTAISIDTIRTNKNRTYWLCECECDCGNKQLKSVYLYQLTSGKQKSCGCEKKNINITHGFTSKGHKHPLYNTWDGMIQRCGNINNHRYSDYGGGNICVTPEWLIFENFKNWAFDNGYKEGLTIERINVNGNYEPNNCKWLTRKEQMRNMRKTRYVDYQGDSHNFLNLIDNLNLSMFRKKIESRVFDLNWSFEKAIKDLKPPSCFLMPSKQEVIG